MPEEKQYDSYPLPDGKIVKFPVGTGEDTVRKYLTENYAESLASTPVSQPTDSFSPNPGFFPRLFDSFGQGLEEGTGKVAPGIRAAIATTTGGEAGENAWNAAQEEMRVVSREAAKGNPDAPSVAEVSAKYEKEGLWSAVGETFDLAAQSIGMSVGYTAPSLALFAGASVASPLVATTLIGAGYAGMTAQFLAEDLARNGENGLTAEEVNLGKVVGLSLGAAATEGLSFYVAGVLGPAFKSAIATGSPVLRRASNRAAATATESALSKIMSKTTVEGKIIATPASTLKYFMRATAVETGTELGQTAMERASAGESITPEEEEDMQEYIETLFGAMLGSIPFSGFGAQQHYVAPRKQMQSAKLASEAARTEVKNVKEAKERAKAVRERNELTHAKRANDIRDRLVAEAKEGHDARLAEVARLGEISRGDIERTPRTILDVQELALDKGLDIDSTPIAEAGFSRLANEVIGHDNIAKATPAELDQLYTRISMFENVDRDTGIVKTIPPSTLGDAVAIAKELEKKAGKKSRKALSRKDLRSKIRAIIKKKASLFTSSRSIDIQTSSIINDMRANGLLLEDNSGSKPAYRADVSSVTYLAKDTVRPIAEKLVDTASRSVRLAKTGRGVEYEVVGEFPTLKQAREEVGPLAKENYDKIVDALESRGVIHKPRKGGRHFFRNVPSVLSTRREFSRQNTPTQKWIVRNQDGAVAHIGESRTDANEFFNANGDRGLVKPRSENGYAVREFEIEDQENVSSRVLRSKAVEWVQDGEFASRVADDRVNQLADTNQKLRKEYLGSAGDVIKSDLDPELARLSRSAIQADVDAAVELLSPLPYNSKFVTNTYRLGIEDNSSAHEVADLGPDNRWYVPFNMFTEFAQPAELIVKTGVLFEDGRGFGMARFNDRVPTWRSDLDAVMDQIGREGKDAFSDTSNLQRYAADDGRTLIVDGVQDEATYYVLDYIDDGTGPKFHVYNIFKGDENYHANVEDRGPFHGEGERHGQTATAESVRVANNPTHMSVRRANPHKLLQDSLVMDFKSSLQSTNIALPKKPKPKGFMGFLNDIIEEKWGENAIEKWRAKQIDSQAATDTNSQRIRDKDGHILGSELNAIHMVRAHARVAHIYQASLDHGSIRMNRIMNKDGTYEGAMTIEQDEYTMTNESGLLPYYDPATDSFTNGQWSGDLFNADRGNLTGGLGTVVTSMEPARFKKLVKYRYAVRAHNIRKRMAIEKPTEVALVPIDEKKTKEWMTLTPADHDIAVASANLNALNEKLIQAGIDGDVLSEEEAQLWRENGDYISFYRDFDGDPDSSYSKRMLQEREQLGIKKNLLGDIRLRDASKRYKGFQLLKNETVEDALMEPIEAMLKNQLAMYTAITANQARLRTLRDGVTLGTVKPWNEKEHGPQSTPVKVKIKGVEHKFFVEDELLFTALEGDKGNTIMQALDMHPTLRWVTTAPSQWLRETVTRNPGFALPNMIRDSAVVALMNPVGGMGFVSKAFKRTAQNIYDDRTKGVGNIGGSAKALSLYGISTGIEDVSTVNNASDMAKRIKRKLETGKQGRGGKIGDIWRAMGRYSAYSESSTRQLVYEHTEAITREKLIREGKFDVKDHDAIARAEALHQAKEILNFSTRGSSTALQFITSMAPFINARMQGIDVLARGLFKYKQVGLDTSISADERQRAMLRRGMYVAAASVALQMLNMDDDNYEGENGYKRDDNWFLRIPGTTGSYITVPAPFELGFLVKTIPEQIYRMAVLASRGETTRGAKDMNRAFTNLAVNTIPTGAAIPVVLRPAAQFFMNKTLHGGIPIESYWEQFTPAKDRFSQKTTAQARAIGQITGPTIGVSPKMVDANIRTLVGGLGMHLWSSIDTILRMPAGYIEDWPVPVKPNPRMSDIMVIRRLLSQGDQTGALIAAYEYRNELEEAWSIVNAAEDPKTKSRLRHDYAPELRARAKLKPIMKQISNIRKQEDKIRANLGSFENRLGSGEMATKLKALAERKKILVSKARDAEREYLKQ